MTGHPIRVAAARTGLSPHLIRMWERRYGAVSPFRTDTNRRLYSDADIRRLRMLKQAADAGESIGQIARLPDDELQQLVSTSGPLPGLMPAVPSGEKAPAAPEEVVSNAIEAVRDMDPEKLEELMLEASTKFSQPVFLMKVVEPMMVEVGELWQKGELRVSHEHMASATLRSIMGNLTSSYSTDPNSPRIICTTPSGQLHEIGALMTATAAASMGWRVTYLGPSLPSEDVAGAAVDRNATAVAISIAYPHDDPRIAEELRRMQKLLPTGTIVMIGGRAAASYQSLADQLGFLFCPDLFTFMEKLSEIGNSRPR